MIKLETNKSKITRRLKSEGWKLSGGTKHEKYIKNSNSILISRQNILSIGVARKVARAAGW